MIEAVIVEITVVITVGDVSFIPIFEIWNILGNPFPLPFF